MKFQKNEIILFQGDSVTDCGRNRQDYHSLGEGYVKLIQNKIETAYPQMTITVLNRGISGDRVKDVAARLEQDCLALKPDWVSILIGINDTWRRYDLGEETTAAQFEATYREVLTRIKAKTNAKLIICEPFVIPVNEQQATWHEDLDPKISVARKLATEFDAIFVPFQVVFDKATETEAPEFFAADGVHPTAVGHELMAATWMTQLEIL